MNRQVRNELSGQAHYSARLGFLRWVVPGIIGIICLSAAACQPLPVPTDGTGSETTLPADSAAQPESDESDAAETDESSADTEEDSAMIELSAPEQMLADLATNDLAAELGVSPDEIKVTTVQAVDFPDSSLGCPEEGMMYAQVITPGYALMLEVDGTVYEYHGTDKADGHVVRCEE